MGAIHVTIIDRNDIYREALVDSLEETDRIKCQVLEYSEFFDTNAVIKSIHRPAVILICRVEDRTSWTKLLQSMRERYPDGRAIVIHETPSPEICSDLFNKGAWGVVPSASSVPTLKKAIHAVSRGEIWADRNSSSLLIRNIVEGNGRTKKTGGPDGNLSHRERQVLALVAAGLKNRQIGMKLHISEQTVKVHLNSIFSKIAVKDRLQAALFAIKNGITPVNVPLRD